MDYKDKIIKILEKADESKLRQIYYFLRGFLGVA